jgi:hypothetical protein
MELNRRQLAILQTYQRWRRTPPTFWSLMKSNAVPFVPGTFPPPQKRSAGKSESFRLAPELGRRSPHHDLSECPKRCDTAENQKDCPRQSPPSRSRSRIPCDSEAILMALVPLIHNAAAPAVSTTIAIHRAPTSARPILRNGTGRTRDAIPSETSCTSNGRKIG